MIASLSFVTNKRNVMDKERIKVITKDDESEEAAHLLILTGIILVACVAISAGILKVIGWEPETGVYIGLAIWLMLVIKVKWMREIVLGMLALLVFIVLFFSILALLFWAFL
jgi:hypothetical protein